MLTWEYLVDTVRDDLPFILSVGTGCAISASCLEKRKHFYLRVALTILLTFCWMYGTRPYVGLNIQGTRMGMIRYTTAFVLFMLSVPFCSRANFCQALYAVTVAYSIQNMCERIIHIPRYSLPNFPVLLDRSCLLALMAIALYSYYRILVGKRRQRTIMDFSNMNIQGTRMGMIRYTTAFVLFMLSVPFCSRANFCQALYAVTVAYSIQNMCERIIHIPRYSLPNFPVLLDRSCLLALMAIALYSYYRILVGKRRQRTIMDFSNMSSCMMLFMGVGVVAISVVLDLTLYRVTPSGNRELSNCHNIMSAVFSLLTIVVCMSHLRETENERKADVAAQMLYSEQRRYEQERQIHDAINLKCHDIRHQIAALGDAGYQEELKKIGQLVNIYDAAPHTQNAALDVALSGKMLACTNLGITMTCLADGRRIGFMEDSDIYALFGNILDNAIEATKTVTEEEKRIISLTIGTTGDLLLIDSQNYYAGEVQFVDGLPQTSKENKEYHGFGTRSIKTLTEKYGGDLKISAENGIFRLSIMLPIPT